MKDIITSKKNSDIKYLRKLYDSRKRRKEKRFILEGTRIIDQALANDSSFYRVFISPNFEGEIIDKLVANKDIKVKQVAEELLAEVADTVSPQGIIAVVDKPGYDIADLFTGTKRALLVLDQIQDPGNMGTIIRSAAGAGIKGIIALKGCVDIYNLKVLRATMGAIFSLPVLTRIEEDEFLEILVDNKDYQLVCTSPEGNQYYFELDYEQAPIFIIGNEARGVSQKIKNRSDYNVKIPLRGKIDSLNAAISTGIILYDYVEKIIN